MKQFLAIYTGTPDAGVEITPEQRAQGAAAWGAWMERNASRIVVAGGPLGRTRRVAKDGIEDIRNRMAAYVIVRAADQDEAARLFEGHPHFAIFPGDGVEVMECLPLPGAGGPHPSSA